jgi:ligand of Numb protein X 1/2
MLILGMMKEPIVPGRLCTVEIHRGYSDLGIHIVGGNDTPLVTTVVQEIKADSVVARDSRLQPGDHILRVIHLLFSYK